MAHEAGEGGGGSTSVFTPPPGDPDTVRSAARAVKSGATSAGDLNADVRRAKVDSTEWSDSTAASAYATFADKVESLCSHTEELVERFARAGGDYADVLDTAQRAIRSAKERYDKASAASTQVIDDVNANPNRTDAQVKTAEAKSAEHAADAQAAVDDATTAWASYESERDIIAKRLHELAATANDGTKGSSLTEPVMHAVEEEERRAESEEKSKGAYEALKLTLMDIRDMRSSAMGWIGYLKHYEKGAGGIFEQGQKWLKSDEAFKNWREFADGKNWEELIKRDLVVKGPEAEDLTKWIGRGGKMLGPLGVAAGGFTTYEDFAHGHKARGVYDGVTTALGGLALVTPPPADLACGAAAGAMAVGELVYDKCPAVHDFVDHRVRDVKEDAKLIGHAAHSAGKNISKAWHSIF